MNYSTASMATQPALTPEVIDRMVDLMMNIPPEPIGEYMKSKGFDPASGGVMVLPESYRAERGPFPPRYVMFSDVVTQPTLGRFNSPQFNLKDILE